MPTQEDTILKTLIGQRVQILAYINFIVRDRDISEDVYQEVSLYTIKNQEKINDEKHLVRYIRRVSRNFSLNAIQKERKKPISVNHQLLDLIESDWQQFDKESSTPMYGALKKCLEDLTPNANNLINLRYAQGISGQKLADRLGKQVNTIYVAISRIHKTLAACIKERCEVRGYKL